MSKPVYLYRAVTVRESLELPARFPLGRMTGYLSRSAAKDAGQRAGVEFVIERSEPVEFLTDTEQMRREIQRLTAAIAEAVSSG